MMAHAPGTLSLPRMKLCSSADDMSQRIYGTIDNAITTTTTKCHADAIEMM